MNLRFKIVILPIIISVIALGAMGYLTAREVNQRVTEQVEEEARLTVSLFDSDVDSQEAVLDSNQIQDIIDRLVKERAQIASFTFNGPVYDAVETAGYRTLASTDLALIWTELRPEIQEVITSGQTVQRVTSQNEQPAIELIMPVIGEGESRAAVEVVTLIGSDETEEIAVDRAFWIARTISAGEDLTTETIDSARLQGIITGLTDEYPELAVVSFHGPVYRQAAILEYHKMASTDSPSVGTLTDPEMIEPITTNETVLDYVKIDGEEYLRVIAPIHVARRAVATVDMLVSLDRVHQETDRITQFAVLATLAVSAVMAILLMVALGQIVIRPLSRLTTSAQAMAAGDLDQELHSLRRDEIGVLSNAFDSMAAQLRDLIGSLEERVNARTRDLRIAADVSRQITTMLDTDRLLQQVVTLTAQSFGLYSTFIFLVDEETGRLVRSATADVEGLGLESETPEDIPLDADPSVIALAARRREAVNIDDVTQSPVYMAVKSLPDTRSELAIPMLLGDHLLGVFDLQSRVPNRFGEDDLRVLTALAEQIAIAVRNAQLYTEAQQARAAAEEADQVKSRFLANMSHELRTPLNAIINFTGFVVDGVWGPVSDEQRDALTKALDSGQHLLSLINDILDLTKIETGVMDLFIQDVDIGASVKSAVSTAKGLVKEKQIQLLTDIEDDLPHIAGDNRRIRQILLNLVSNAVKFTPEGHVSISAHHSDGKIHIAVSDTGVGIAPEDQPLVFESFRRAKHDLPDTIGTGLGIPISKHFVEAHGGRLTFESEPGIGTTFHLWLPVKSSETEGTPEPQDNAVVSEK